ncbi:hypothetical protein SAMN02745166_03473 [Prosthecobacter debontii]|uniref:Uncharacterized protein n=1 Tax=Prosthecobacter debontii TaxID=48467 RepID=A0A1T4YJ17_9BACT|nr:hypothetical protein SAMN02745166_03473 [Prosthecobacter debontii]
MTLTTSKIHVESRGANVPPLTRSMSATITTATVRTAMVTECAVTINWMPMTIISSDRTLTIHSGTAESAGMRNAASGRVMIVSGLRHSWSQDCKSSRDSNQEKQFFHNQEFKF